MADFTYELRADIPRVLVEVVPGEALSVTVPLLDEDNAAVAAASDWTVLAQLRAAAADTTVLHTFTTDAPANATVNAGATGSVTLSATAVETAAWQTAWGSSPPEALADLFVTDSDGAPRCVADLVFALLPRVTRED